MTSHRFWNLILAPRDIADPRPLKTGEDDKSGFTGLAVCGFSVRPDGSQSPARTISNLSPASVQKLGFEDQGIVSYRVRHTAAPKRVPEQTNAEPSQKQSFAEAGLKRFNETLHQTRSLHKDFQQSANKRGAVRPICARQVAQHPLRQPQDGRPSQPSHLDRSVNEALAFSRTEGGFRRYFGSGVA